MNDQRAHPDKNHQGEHASAMGHNETDGWEGVATERARGHG